MNNAKVIMVILVSGFVSHIAIAQTNNIVCACKENPTITLEIPLGDLDEKIGQIEQQDPNVQISAPNVGFNQYLKGSIAWACVTAKFSKQISYRNDLRCQKLFLKNKAKEKLE